MTRSELLTARFTPEEADRVRAGAAEAGLPVSEYVRRSVLSGSAQVDEAGRLRELRKISALLAGDRHAPTPVANDDSGASGEGDR